MEFRKGLAAGIPIGLGYLSVSFSFGILAVSEGLSWWQAVLISLLNVTSAGQVAGVGIMTSAGGPIEMAVTTVVINLRYSLMGLSISQKADRTLNVPARLLVANFITDEIFGVTCGRKEDASRNFMLGIAAVPVLGWTLGTLLGALLGSVLPSVVASSLAIGIYGMFVAIVVPKAEEDRTILRVSLIAVALSCLFWYVPVLKEHVSTGFAIIICAVVAALIGVFSGDPGKKEGEAHG